MPGKLDFASVKLASFIGYQASLGLKDANKISGFDFSDLYIWLHAIAR